VERTSLSPTLQTRWDCAIESIGKSQRSNRAKQPTIRLSARRWMPEPAAGMPFFSLHSWPGSGHGWKMDAEDGNLTYVQLHTSLPMNGTIDM
jgi:hypothetical protein